MYRATPIANKVLHRRIVSKQQQLHRRGIYSAKAVCRIESEDKIQLNNRKKELQIQQKYTQIQRQNRILLQKITKIMGKSGDKDRKTSYRSLNYSHRKKQLQSIEQQNFRMLRRLKGQKSYYNANRMRKDWLKNRQNIKDHTQLPIRLNALRSRADSVKEQKQTDRKLISVQEIELAGRKFKIQIMKENKALIIEGYDYKDDDYKIIKVPWSQVKQLLKDNQTSIISKIRYSNDKLYFII